MHRTAKIAHSPVVWALLATWLIVAGAACAAPPAASRPATEPATRPAWERLINCTLKFPRDSEAADCTKAQWQVAAANLKEGGELVGQMQTSEVSVGKDGAVTITLVQVETGPKDFITRNGVAYLVNLRTSQRGAVAIKKGDFVLFVGKVESVEVKSVESRPLNDTELLDGYVLHITIAEPILRLGNLTSDPAEHENPHAKESRRKLVGLNAKLRSLQSRQNAMARAKAPSRKALEDIAEQMHEVAAEIKEVRLRSHIDELKWCLLGADEAK